MFDIEMMETTGACAGIENYSRYLTGRKPGEPPPTLFEYFPENSLLIVDESHVTVPQIGGMFRGDFSRKSVLAEFGFRLPSAIDNRPLKFEEWEAMRPQTIFVSRHARPVGDGAHPGHLHRAGDPADRADRPDGDHPAGREPGRRPDRRVQGLREEGQRVLVTTLTKRMAEDLVEYMHEAGIRVPLPAFRHRHARAHRDHPRPAAGRVRRAGRHQPAARGPRHPRMRAGGHPRRRQGGLPALADLAGADHRPRRPQRRRPRHPLCRQDDRTRSSTRSPRPTGAAPSRSPTTRRTASRRPRSRRTSTKSCSRPPSATTTRSIPACRATCI